MKLIIKETAPSGILRTVFATSRLEMEIVLGCLKRYKANIPVGEQWKQEGRCLTNMIAGIDKALKKESLLTQKEEAK